MSSSFGNAQGMQSAVVTLQQGCRPEMVNNPSCGKLVFLLFNINVVPFSV